MAVAQKTSIWGRGIDTLRDTTGKIKRAGSGVINQIKPFGTGKKPKIGPTGGGYQPRGQFGGKPTGPGYLESATADARSKARAGWGKRYGEEMNRRYGQWGDAVERSKWERRMMEGRSWQPWKDPKRGFGGGRLPSSPTLTPLGAGNQAAKEGARKVGQKVIAGGAAKGLGLGLKAVPILGGAIIAGQSGFELGKGIAEALNEAERKIWEIAGYVPPIGENGTVPGTPPDIIDPPPEFPPASPIIELAPDPPPGDYSDNPIAIGTLGDGWHKLHVKIWQTRSYSTYRRSVFTGLYQLESDERLGADGEGWAWVLGPGQKFKDIQRLFNDTRDYFGTWSILIFHFIGCRGWWPATSDPNEPPPAQLPNNFVNEPAKFNLYPMAGFSTMSEKSWGYFPGRNRYIKDDSGVTVSIKWYTPEGIPEDDVPEIPAPFPNRPRRREEEDMADCPNIKPLLIQQNAIIEAKLNQQITEVNEIVAGMQLEINAGNQLIVDAVNDANANIAVDMTDVKNRLGPQIPDGISTKVSNHYDEFKNFLGEGWNTAKGTFNDLMDKFNEYLETFKKFLKWMHIDRVLNILTFIATVHNAYMLSANLGQTLISALNTIFTVVGNSLGLRDVEDAPIEVGEAIGDTFENLAKTILGAENLENMRAEWKKYSRIYQAASHLLWAIQSINQSIIGALEIVGSNVAKIGNAIKKWGEVAENAYAWMNPTPYFQNKFFTTLESLEDAGGTVEIVALETLSAQEEISQFQQVKEEFDKAMSQANDGKQSAGSPEAQQVKAAEDANKTASTGTID